LAIVCILLDAHIGLSLRLKNKKSAPVIGLFTIRHASAFDMPPNPYDDTRQDTKNTGWMFVRRRLMPETGRGKTKPATGPR
jgi:hypothetical protein